MMKLEIRERMKVKSLTYGDIVKTTLYELVSTQISGSASSQGFDFQQAVFKGVKQGRLVNQWEEHMIENLKDLIVERAPMNYEQYISFNA